VSNVTDVEDKIIARAAEEGSTEPDVATAITGRVLAEMDRLGVRRPTPAGANAYTMEW